MNRNIGSMRNRNTCWFPLAVLTATFALMPADRLAAQAFLVLHTFMATSQITLYTNSDGASPEGQLVLSGNTLYGTASAGGSSSNGVVFKLNSDGSGFSNLHNFTKTAGPSVTNSDGAFLAAGLVLSSNILYGTASSGGFFGYGTVFSINTDGTAFAVLHTFTGASDGANPYAGLVLSGNILYGAASDGGGSSNGTVFAINTDGTGFTILHSFTARILGGTNGDGARPMGTLVFSGNTLYGTTWQGGGFGAGAVFAVNTDGTGFMNLHSFTSAQPAPLFVTNSDGALPVAGLALSGNTLYGVTWSGGTSGSGVAFKINTDGSGFTTLHSFAGSDGGNPRAGMILSNDTLYGVAEGGNTVFAVNTNGTGFTALYHFTDGSDGSSPVGGLVLSGNTLYGTTTSGGSSGSGVMFSSGVGTVFSLMIPPQLTITPAGAGVVLAWPTNTPGFTLQSAASLVPPVVWTPVFPSPVVVNGQYAVTNPISGNQQFYRLSQ
jgi:uncharacterized repeat protein (TIGR03803 family)